MASKQPSGSKPTGLKSKYLVLTMHDDEQHILRMIRAGATDTF